METAEAKEIDTAWTKVCDLAEISVGSGTCARLGGAQVAVFRISESEIRAVQNVCPHSGMPVLHQGVVGDHGGEPKVACPLHKRVYSLEDGRNLSGENGKVRVFGARIEDNAIWVGGR
jgi:nitrite reductase (NADH) small subunit